MHGIIYEGVNDFARRDSSVIRDAEKDDIITIDVISINCAFSDLDGCAPLGRTETSLFNLIF